MAVTSQDIANQAIQYIGNNQPFITGQAPTFDDSTTGKILQKIYAPCVAAVQRQWGWDASRNTVALTLSGNPAPFPWALQYLYPTNGIQVWQLLSAAADKLNPLPANWSVANDIVAAIQVKVINTDLAAALAVYNNNPNENTWDALFREAVARLLASELAMASAGRPDAAQAMLESGAALENIAEKRGE